ncbi:MAG: AbrB/MazE/SpoVT family DNA-binding domain-containing protein [Aeromicrobium sp.]|uniref:hypothetical protein n=1 Tax=Aeromicrobium sp. TaxID=1871063 RepID=UPI0039E33B7F
MSATYQAMMGDHGDMVIPAELRERAGLVPGAGVTMVETDQGIVLLTRDQLKQWVRRDLAGLDLVEELLADRRDAAAVDAA